MAASAARRSGSRAAAERPRAPAMLETAARPAITIATTTNALADLRMNRLSANESNAAFRGNVDARPERRTGSPISRGSARAEPGLPGGLPDSKPRPRAQPRVEQ